MVVPEGVFGRGQHLSSILCLIKTEKKVFAVAKMVISVLQGGLKRAEFFQILFNRHVQHHRLQHSGRGLDI